MKDKLIEKQKELIKLLDDALDCMTELGDGKLRQEIWKLESELAKEQEQIAEEVECDHPKDRRDFYHDGCIVCRQCNCIISQYGKEINPPSKLSML